MIPMTMVEMHKMFEKLIFRSVSNMTETVWNILSVVYND